VGGGGGGGSHEIPMEGGRLPDRPRWRTTTTLEAALSGRSAILLPSPRDIRRFRGRTMDGLGGRLLDSRTSGSSGESIVLVARRSRPFSRVAALGGIHNGVEQCMDAPVVPDLVAASGLGRSARSARQGHGAPLPDRVTAQGEGRSAGQRRQGALAPSHRSGCAKVEGRASSPIRAARCTRASSQILVVQKGEGKVRPGQRPPGRTWPLGTIGCFQRSREVSPVKAPPGGTAPPGTDLVVARSLFSGGSAGSTPPAATRGPLVPDSRLPRSRGRIKPGQVAGQRTCAPPDLVVPQSRGR